MRVLVTGGAGFIGSHFVQRLAAAGDEVVVLDKLTYAGNPANLDGVEHEFHQGDIADPGRGRARRRRAATRSSTSPPSPTSTARSSAPAEFILTDVLGTQVLLDHAREAGIRLVQVSTDEVYGDIPLDAQAVQRGRAAAALEPVLGVEGGRRPAGARLRPHVRRRCAASRAARTPTGRASTRRS